MALLVLTGGLLAASLVALIILFRRRRSLRQLRGPPSPFLLGVFSFQQYFYGIDVPLGNIREIPYQENVGDLDFRWVNEYGTAWRIGGTFGVRIRPNSSELCLDIRYRKTY